MIADGLIDREPPVRVFDKPALSVPAELTPGQTGDLTDQLERLVLPGGGEGRQTDSQAGPRHHLDIEPAGLSLSGLVEGSTGDIGLASQ